MTTTTMRAGTGLQVNPSVRAIRSLESTPLVASSRLVLVVGGTGVAGSRIVQSLRHRGVPVRVGSRDANPRFDWDDETTWSASLNGVDRVYIAHPLIDHGPAAAAVARFAAQAAAAGIDRAVLVTGRNRTAAIALVEESVRAGMEGSVILRPSWFSQNFSTGWADDIRAGAVDVPLGAATEPFIDADDVAAVAVAALLDDAHGGQTYTLTGPRALSCADLAHELSRVTGRSVNVTSSNPDSDYFDGSRSNVTDDVERLLGRKAIEFSHFAQRTSAAGTWG